MDAPRGRQGRHPLNPKPGAKLQEPLGEGTSRVTVSQPKTTFPTGSICISLEMPILFRTPLSVDRKGSQKNPTDSSFLLQGAPIPSLPSLYTAGAFMLLKSSFPFVRAASTPTPFSCWLPFCSKPLCPPQTGTLCSNSGSRELVAWRAPTWEPEGEAVTLCFPRPPPSATPQHSAPRRAASSWPSAPQLS